MKKTTRQRKMNPEPARAQAGAVAADREDARPRPAVARGRRLHHDVGRVGPSFHQPSLAGRELGG